MPDQQELFETSDDSGAASKNPETQWGRQRAVSDPEYSCSRFMEQFQQSVHKVESPASDIDPILDLLEKFDTVSPPALARKVRQLLPEQQLSAIPLLVGHDELLVLLTEITEGKYAEGVLHVALDKVVSNQADADTCLRELVGAAEGRWGYLSQKHEENLRAAGGSFYRKYLEGKENLRSMLGAYVSSNSNVDGTTFSSFLSCRKKR
jgi:hypothetical protein